MEIEVSYGEIIDKLSILYIKKKNMRNRKKLINIKKEFEYLKRKVKMLGITTKSSFFKSLLVVNTQLWKIENRLREKEKEKKFDKEFIELARKVYRLNDMRNSIKRTINKKMKSKFFEEKQYSIY